MSFQIEVQSEYKVDPGIDKAITTATSTALRFSGISSAALTILLTDDKHMRQLNRDFRDLDSPTDVLSFPSGENEFAAPEEVPYLGDIAISVPIAEQQAQTNGHPLTAELQLLAIHGVLHLLGYDHYSPEEKGEMWAAQADILDALGLHHIKATEN